MASRIQYSITVLLLLLLLERNARRKKRARGRTRVKSAAAERESRRAGFIRARNLRASMPKRVGLEKNPASSASGASFAWVALSLLSLTFCCHLHYRQAALTRISTLKISRPVGQPEIVAESARPLARVAVLGRRRCLVRHPRDRLGLQETRTRCLRARRRCKLSTSFPLFSFPATCLHSLQAALALMHPPHCGTTGSQTVTAVAARVCVDPDCQLGGQQTDPKQGLEIPRRFPSQGSSSSCMNTHQTFSL